MLIRLTHQFDRIISAIAPTPVLIPIPVRNPTLRDLNNMREIHLRVCELNSARRR